MKSLPIFKSHYSLGKSILTLDKPKGKIDYDPVSIIDLALHAKLSQLVLVEDNMTSFLEAVKHCEDNKLHLMFGLRLFVTRSIQDQTEETLKHRARYIVFAKNNEGYKNLIKIWTCASKEGFYYTPCIDFENLKRLWDDNVLLAVPFYDSFLHLNCLEGNLHVPDFDEIRPTFFLENNDLPFDPLLRKKAMEYATTYKFDTLETSTIYYRSRLDFIAYMTFRCINERTNIEKPELDHMGSDSFNFDRWLRNNQ